MDSERTSNSVPIALKRFAERLREEIGAERVLLFGPHARGIYAPDRDYNLIIVAGHFRSLRPIERPIRLYDLFSQAGGDAPLSLMCLTPEEFDDAGSAPATFVNAVLPDAIDVLAAPVRTTAEEEAMRRPRPPTIDPTIARFAERLREAIGAERVLLFGSQARGTAAPDSDHDLIVVAGSFRSVPHLQRSAGLRNLYYEVGGRAPLDLICLTPEEFAEAGTNITLVNAVLPHAIDLLPAPVENLT